MKILVVEDEPKTGDYLRQGLNEAGYVVDLARNGTDGAHLAVTEDYDLVVLDVMLPGLDGWGVLRAIRTAGRSMPVLFLTARSQVDDRVKGLELGADDYLLKPFGQRELLARIHAILRRTGPPAPALDTAAFGDVTVDFKRMTAVKGRKEIYLTAKEYDLLHFLLAHEGEVVDRDTLLNEVWGYEKFPTTRTIDTFVHNLRKKIEKDPARPVHLLTVPWSGYKFQR
jgi:two-component system copper resistance phosphate regulon response regulator CusR